LQVQASYGKGIVVAERQWHKLLKSVGTDLSQKIYTLINWFSQSDGDEAGQRDKKKKATMQVQ
jgi:hypothetical protein